MNKKEQMNHKGFTLIELLLVISIIGILAAIAVPNIQQKYRNRKAEIHESDLVDRFGQPTRRESVAGGQTLYYYKQAGNEYMVCTVVDGKVVRSEMTRIEQKNDW